MNWSASAGAWAVSDAPIAWLRCPTGGTHLRRRKTDHDPNRPNSQPQPTSAPLDGSAHTLLPLADGTFVYAVKTTGVFCRPSCPARPAKPQNVAFFATGAEAEAAGYRACLRCRPLAAEGRDPMTDRVEKLAAFIRAHADEPLPLSRLAQQASLSPFHLQRSFKAVLGVTPLEFQAAERLKAFKAALRDGDSVLGATFEAGYGSASRVYEQVDGSLGMTPSAISGGRRG